MPGLSNLIQSLSKYEIRIVRLIIQVNGNRERLKRDQLFELLLEGKDEEAAAKEIGYSHSRISSFINLCQRLQDDILKALLLTDQENEEEMPFLQAQFDCRRALLQADLLQSRNCFDEADALIERTLRVARKSELFSEQLLLNDLRRNTPAIQQNAESFRQLSREIMQLHDCQADVLRARQLHYELLTPELIQSVSLADFQSKGMQRLNEMGKKISSSSSNRMSFYYHLSAMNFYNTLRSFPEAGEHGHHLLSLIRSSPILHTESNVVAVSIELSGIALAQGENAQAAEYAQQALEMSDSLYEQQFQAARMLALAHFRNGNHLAATQVISQALGNRKVAQFPLLRARLELLTAAIALEEKAYKASANQIARCGDLVNDHRGWMPGLFLIDLQLNLERGMMDVAAHRLNAFRYSVRRPETDKTPNDKRLGTIMLLLNKLIRSNLGFKQLDIQEAHRIELLRRNEDDFWWNPAGYELIRFDKWLMRCNA
ncbi:MAG: hypothetical protein MUC87_06325 [Bacteroidia bacterium]|jgi:hypothetical protein|nr:hypothetical protein [Bacteroidia bacterium]